MASRLRSGLAVDSAYERLRGDIVAGHLTPNQRLVEADLVEELGVSRATIRAALTKLDHDGLIIREYNHGARVRMVTEEEAVEIVQTRSALEALAARHAALNATDEDIAEIEAIRAEMPKLLAEGDLLGYSECNSRLHARIIAASRHSIAQRLITDLKAQMVRFQYRTILVPGRSKQSLAEHTAIVEAIVAHDADAAEVAMRRHISHVATTLSQTTGAEAQRTHRIREAPVKSS
jgi:DNA-binding GntR family transcriptional regulator